MKAYTRKLLILIAMLCVVAVFIYKYNQNKKTQSFYYGTYVEKEVNLAKEDCNNLILSVGEAKNFNIYCDNKKIDYGYVKEVGENIIFEGKNNTYISKMHDGNLLFPFVIDNYSYTLILKHIGYHETGFIEG